MRVAQGDNAPSFTERNEHLKSLSGALLFKCDSSAGLGDTIMCALARPRLHSLAPSAPSCHANPLPRQPLHLGPIPPHSDRVFFTVAPQGHIVRVHRRIQLFSVSADCNMLGGSLGRSEVPRWRRSYDSFCAKLNRVCLGCGYVETHRRCARGAKQTSKSDSTRDFGSRKPLTRS